jgi:hypothetical protein
MNGVTNMPEIIMNENKELLTEYDFVTKENKNEKSSKNEVNMDEIINLYCKTKKIEYLDILFGIQDIEKLNEMKQNTFQNLLPNICEWLKDVKTAKYGFIYLFEGTKLYSEIFSNPNNKTMIKKITQSIINLENDIKKIGINMDSVIEIYNFLISIEQ